MISVEHLTHQIQCGEQVLTILQDINLQIKDGESLAITGSSGSGKTTLLGLLAGLDVPSSGRVVVAGQELSAMSEDARALFRARAVGFVFQAFHLLPGLTALENVLLPLELAGNHQGQERARELLAQVGLSHRLQHYPGQLSGGEQQRVAIARAFACSPRYLFADEPTGNLDEQTGSNIIELLFRLNAEQQTTLVLVTHEARLAALCQRQVRIENQHLYEVSTQGAMV